MYKLLLWTIFILLLWNLIVVSSMSSVIQEKNKPIKPVPVMELEIIPDSELL